MVNFALVLGVVLVLGHLLYRRQLRRVRTHRIETFRFPATIGRKVKAAYPHLGDAQVAQVLDGLREFFLLTAAAEGRLVSMPSRVVDVAWHEFILFTRLYQEFCRDALGRFLHHTPAEAMRTPSVAQDGIRRAWRLSCAREHIDPKRPARLPLLFALDQELAIADGFRYVLNCAAATSASATGEIYCASDIGCSGGCAGESGSWGDSSPGGDGPGDGGADGGGDSGCGGGGCGGGGD